VTATFCQHCGRELPADASFCPNCGKTTLSPSIQTTEKTRPTRAWYFIALILPILGGIIGYFAVRKDDAKMANNLLLFGILVWVAILAIPIIILMLLGIWSAGIPT
jgi:uncharacterized membrane protein YvbJ